MPRPSFQDRDMEQSRMRESVTHPSLLPATPGRKGVPTVSLPKKVDGVSFSVLPLLLRKRLTMPTARSRTSCSASLEIAEGIHPSRGRLAGALVPVSNLSLDSGVSIARPLEEASLYRDYLFRATAPPLPTLFFSHVRISWWSEHSSRS